MAKRQGKLDFGDGIYDGELLGDVMHGHGTATFASGDVYSGDWRNDLFHGQGTYRWADGDTYTGEYQKEKQHGMGTLQDQAGTYTGRWIEDARDGWGKQEYKTGEIYEGEWRNDMKHGRGKTAHANGSWYEGEWLNDQQHGKGITRNVAGDIYEGEFLNGQPNGKGVYRWADGGSFVGYFVDGLRHGEGCERKANGSWIAGHWIAGEHDKTQPVHFVDSAQVAAQQEGLFNALQLDQAIRPMPVDRLKSQAHAGEVLGPNVRGPSTATAPTAAAAPPRSGATIFSDADFINFKTQKLLGKGSYGAVYEAMLQTGRIVCVKIVELGTLTDLPAEIAKLHNEIDLMKRMSHPNIVQYYGSSEDKHKNCLNIFMEYVTGGSLNHFIKRFKQIPRDTLRQWTFQLVCGVKYLHDNSIVHRDIKGDNILVTLDGVLKLADFGCSKAIDDVCSKSHGCQTMVGTPYWMAPEVIKCDPEGYGRKSDIWSIGCTVVEMVTGKPPWPECNSMWAAVYKIANSTGLPTEIPSDLGPEMMDFLEQCFVRDPNKRASADDLLNHPWIIEFSQK